MEISERKITLFYKIFCALLPERCPFCDKPVRPGELYCKKCKHKLVFINCKGYTKGAFECVSTFPYAKHHKAAITRYKFSGRKQYAYALARMMADTILEKYKDQEFDLITYVPLHSQKHKARGFNQCELLATHLSRILSIPCKGTLIKTKNTAPQYTLKNPTQREANVKGAFKIKSEQLVQDKRILLIDDIITTGSTLGECAKVLLKYNPASIHCATFAISVAKTT